MIWTECEYHTYDLNALLMNLLEKDIQRDKKFSSSQEYE